MPRRARPRVARRELPGTRSSLIAEARCGRCRPTPGRATSASCATCSSARSCSSGDACSAGATCASSRADSRRPRPRTSTLTLLEVERRHIERVLRAEGGHVEARRGAARHPAQLAVPEDQEVRDRVGGKTPGSQPTYTSRCTCSRDPHSARFCGRHPGPRSRCACSCRDQPVDQQRALRRRGRRARRRSLHSRDRLRRRSMGRGFSRPSTAERVRAASNEGLSDGGGESVVPLAIESLAIDPATPSTLYAGLQQDGIFKSTDGPASWHRLASSDMLGLTVDPKTPATVYANTGSAILKSVDGGATWNPTPTPEGAVASGSVAIDPAHTDVLYATAAPRQRRERRSPLRDAGASWTVSRNARAGRECGERGGRLRFPRFRCPPCGAHAEPGRRSHLDQGPGRHFLPVFPIGASELYVAGIYGTGPNDSFPSQAFRSTDGRRPLVSAVRARRAAEPVRVERGRAGHGLRRRFVRRSQEHRWGRHMEPEERRHPGSVGHARIGSRQPRARLCPERRRPVSAAAMRGQLVPGKSGPVPDSVSIQPGSFSLYSLLGKSVDGGSTWQPVAYPDDGAVLVRR